MFTDNSCHPSFGRLHTIQNSDIREQSPRILNSLGREQKLPFHLCHRQHRQHEQVYKEDDDAGLAGCLHSHLNTCTKLPRRECWNAANAVTLQDVETRHNGKLASLLPLCLEIAAAQLDNKWMEKYCSNWHHCSVLWIHTHHVRATENCVTGQPTVAL